MSKEAKFGNEADSNRGQSLKTQSHEDSRNRKSSGRETNRAEEELVKKVVSRYEDAMQWRGVYEEKWKRFYKLYRSQAMPRDDPSKANMFIPEVFATVETIMPRLVAGYLTSTKSPADIVGREESDQENAEATQAIVCYQLEKNDFPLFLDAFVKPALLYGTSVAKVYWTTREGYDGPTFEPLDLFDFFIDPGSKSIDDARYVIHRKMISMEELETRTKIYRNIDKVKSGSGTDDNRSPAAHAKKEDQSNRDGDERDIEILEYWEDSRVITIANRTVLLREQKNPFAHGKKPFVNIVTIPVPDEFYGIGVVEPLEGLQNELNTKRNQRLDNVNLIINRMWLMASGAVDDLRQLKSRPGGVIVANDINGIRPLPVSDVTGSAYQEEQMILRDIQNTSGISEFVRGSQMYGNDPRITATEIRVKVEQATSRLDYNLKLMAVQGIRRLIQLMIALNQQFIETEQVIRVIGPQGAVFRRILPEEIKGSFDVKVQPDPAGIGEQENLKKVQTALQMVMGLQGANPLPLVEDVLERLGVNEERRAQVLGPLIKQREMQEAAQQQAFMQQQALQQQGLQQQGLQQQALQQQGLQQQGLQQQELQ